MAFCKNCGMSIKDGAQFCTGCGMRLGDAFCPNCGEKLASALQPFCTGCGHRLATNSPATAVKVLSPIPPPYIQQPVYAAPKRKASKKGVVAAVAAVVAVVMITGIVLAVVKFAQKDTVTTSGTALPVYSENDLNVKPVVAKVTEQNPVATADKVRIDFGQFNLEGEQEVQIKTLPVKEDTSGGLKVSSYDFALEGRTQFDDTVNITLPYDEGYLAGNDEQTSVAAKYYNESTSEWEFVPFEVDTANNTVTLSTTHLSVYGVFQVNNENTRKAYIGSVYRSMMGIDSATAKAIFEEYVQNNGEPGETAFQTGFGAVSEFTSHSNSAVTLLTMGGMYETDFTYVLSEGFKYAGVGLAFVQLGYDMCYSENVETATNLTKNIMYSTVDFVGTSALQVAFVGVYIIDYSLTSFGNEALATRLENVGRVYRYYNDKEAPRSLKEWRKIFIDIYNNNKNDPAKAKELMDQEIDAFCQRFWDLDSAKQEEIAGVAGYSNMAWPNSADITALKANYKYHLIESLYPVFTSLKNYMLQQINQEYGKRLEALKKLLNQTITFKVTEELNAGEKSKYAGYTVRLAPLSPDADPKNWTGVMKKDGTVQTSFTVIGHMQCGSPNTIELYKPGDTPGEEAPVRVVQFKVASPITTVSLRNEDITLDELVGDWDVVTEVTDFNMSALNGLAEGLQGVEGLGDYLSQYGSYLNNNNYLGKYDGSMTIEKTGDNTASVVISAENNLYAGYEGSSSVIYAGVYENGVMTLTPQQELAGGEMKIAFTRSGSAITGTSTVDYKSDIVSYSYNFTATKQP